MSTSHHRLPRAGIDRIADEETALATILAAVHEPLRAETIALLLDDDRRGRAIVVVSGTHHADAVVEVVECLAHTVEGLSALVIATVRPSRRGDLITDPARPAGWVDDIRSGRRLPDRSRRGHGRPGCDRTDIDRWLEMSELADQQGVELIEWFVIGQQIVCPRDAFGEHPRW